MAIFVLQPLTKDPLSISIGFMSGARVAGSSAGPACVRCAGHRSTDFDRTSNSVSAVITSFSFFSVLLQMEKGKGKRQPLDGPTVPLRAPTMTSKYAKLGISLSGFFFFRLWSIHTRCFSFIRASG
jgi:hypothetical protein